MISQEIFNSEMTMCRELHAKQGGCNWGTCESCGVIPLLYKLQSGTILEAKQDVDKLKAKIFNS